MPYPTRNYRILDDGNCPVDCHFGVTTDSEKLVVTLESRSGSPTSNPRNIDYATGLELILYRLQFIGAVIDDIRVESTTTKNLSEEECRLKGEIVLPLPLIGITDLHELRLKITAAQRASAHPEGGGLLRRLHR